MGGAPSNGDSGAPPRNSTRRRPVRPHSMKDAPGSGHRTVVTLLGLFVIFIALAGLEVLILSAPISPFDWVVLTAGYATLTAVGWSVSALWRRMTRKRRQYRNTG